MRVVFLLVDKMAINGVLTKAFRLGKSEYPPRADQILASERLQTAVKSLVHIPKRYAFGGSGS